MTQLATWRIIVTNRKRRGNNYRKHYYNREELEGYTVEIQVIGTEVHYVEVESEEQAMEMIFDKHESEFVDRELSWYSDGEVTDIEDLG